MSQQQHKDTGKGAVSRGKKPMPLNLFSMDEPPRMRGNSNPNAQQSNFVHNPMPMPTEELLELMSTIGTVVRRNEFNAALATQVYRLCQQLKMCGDVMEANYPNEMNACFVALRQACCRDSGALGSTCRLKIMELIELRAMGWRPNFSHSQYYVQRQQHATLPQYILAGTPSVNGINASGVNFGGRPESTTASAWDAAALLAGSNAPVSAPPFGAIPINPFAGAPGSVRGVTLPVLHFKQRSLQGPQQAGMMMGPDGAPTGFYLVPATAGFMPNPHQGAWIPPNSPLNTSFNMNYGFLTPNFCPSPVLFGAFFAFAVMIYFFSPVMEL